MAKGLAGPAQNIGPLVALVILGVIAIFLGWSVATGMSGVSIYGLEVLALFILTTAKPAIGLVSFFILSSVLAFVPVDVLMAGTTTEYYIFGLSAINVVLLVLVLAWGLRFIVVQREFLPAGPIGKILVIFMAFTSVNLVRTLITRVFLDIHNPDTVLSYVALWRAYMIAPIFVFMVLNTHVSARMFRFVLWSYVAIVSIGIAFAFAEVLEYSTSAKLAVLLRGAPVDLQLMTAPMVTVGLFMIVRGRNLLARLFWVGLLVLMVVPVAYLHRRATYLVVLLQGLLTFMYLMKSKASNKIVVALLFAGATFGLVYYMPQTIIDRVTSTFYAPSGEEVLDSSVSVRFRLWEVWIDAVREDPWILLVGMGLGRSDVITRRGFGQGLSFHNAWLSDVAEGGILLLAIHIASLVIFYRTFRFMAQSPVPIVKAFGVALMISIFTVQPWAMTHNFSVSSGPYVMMSWFVGALATVQMRPGGMFADVRGPDGRMGMEILGLSSGKRTEDASSAAQQGKLEHLDRNEMPTAADH